MKHDGQGFSGSLRVLAVGAALAAIVCIPLPGDSLLLQDLANAGHAILFGIASLFLLRDRRGRATHYLAAWAVTVLLGLATELIQKAIGLDFELLDVVRDAAGAAAFLAVTWTVFHEARRGTVSLLRAAAVVVMVGVFIPPIHTAAAISRRWLISPMIADFESFLDARLCTRSKDVRIVSEAGNRVMRVTFRPAKYSGWAVDGPFRLWSGYRRLLFTVHSRLTEPVALNVRIHDARHNNAYRDRFNTTVKIQPGFNQVAIPLEDVRTAPRGREMDMGRIRAIGMFVMEIPAAFELDFDDFRLEK